MLYITLTLIAGAAVTLQGVINSKLNQRWDLWSTLVLNAVVFLIIMSVSWGLTGAHLPSRSVVQNTPWYLLLGGICGAVTVVLGTIVFGRLSASLVIALFLVGQLVTSTLIDHYGWLGMTRHPLTSGRILGLALLGAGALLLRK